MHEHDVVFGGAERGQCIDHGLLAVVAAFDHAHAAGQTELGNLGVGALHLVGAHGDDDLRDTRDCGKGFQAVHQHRQAAEREELLGGIGMCDGAHAGSESGCRQNGEYFHSYPMLLLWRAAARAGTR